MDIAKINTELKALMSSNMGITRHAAQLEQALIQIQQWQHQLDSYTENISNMKSTDISIGSNALVSFQLARQLQLATLIIQSAYQRLESRGGHYRKDYPNADTSPKTSVITPLLEPILNAREDGISRFIQPIIEHTETKENVATAIP